MRPVLNTILHNLTARELPMPAEEWTGGREILHIPYAADSVSQYLDLYLPEWDGLLPLLILVHGGGFIFGDSQSRQAQWMYRYFREHGFACASVNYRLAQEAPWPAAVEDAKAAIRFLRLHGAEYGIDTERVAIWGESAGGYIAAMAALTPDGTFDSVPCIGQGSTAVSAAVRVLVDFYGVASLGDMSADFREEGIPRWLHQAGNAFFRIPEMKAENYKTCTDYFLRRQTAELSKEELAAYSPISWTDRRNPVDLGVVIVHGDADITVPTLQSRRLAKALTSRLGSEAVNAVYPHGCKHADDRLYRKELLESLETKIRQFFEEKNK